MGSTQEGEMINKQDLKNYEFKSIEEYFVYILESKKNSNYNQTKIFIKDLSNNQFIQFINWLKGGCLIEKDILTYTQYFLEIRGLKKTKREK